MKPIIAVVGTGGFISILQHPYTDSLALPAVAGNAQCCQFSHAGDLLFVGTSMGPNFLTAIDTQTWLPVGGLPALSHSVSDLALSPSGQYLAIAYGNSGPRLQILDLYTGDLVVGLPAIGLSVNKVAWSPDGQYLGLGTSSGVSLLRAADWTFREPQAVLSDVSNAISFSPDGRWVARGGSSVVHFNVIRVEDLVVLTGIPSPGGVGRAIGFSPDTQTMVLGSSNGLFRWNTENWTLINPTLVFTGSNAIQSLEWMPDGSAVVCAHSNGSRLTIVDAETWTVVPGTPTMPNNALDVSISPDRTMPARRIVTRDHAGNAISANAKMIAPSTWTVVTQTVTDAQGEGLIRSYREGQFVFAMVDQRQGVWMYDAQVASMGDENDPPIELFLDYAGPLVTISGQATTTSGVEVDEVVIRAWSSRKLVARVYPDAGGEWSAEVPPGRYDLTYIKEGCEPINHGPYNVELPDP